MARNDDRKALIKALDMRDVKTMRGDHETTREDDEKFKWFAQGKLKLSFQSVELDKIGDYWVLRWLAYTDVMLQLKIREYTSEWPAEFTCEAKLRDSHTWVKIARFSFETITLSQYAQSTPHFCAFPEMWRYAFVAMARHWARLNDITQFAVSPVVWRNGDPVFVDSTERDLMPGREQEDLRLEEVPVPKPTVH